MRGVAGKWVDENFKIYEDGQVAPQSKLAMEVVKNSQNLKGLTLDQIKAALGKQYIVEEAKSRFKTSEGIMTEKPININTGGGGGGFTPDSFNWAVGAQERSPIVTPELAKRIVGDDSPEAVEKAQDIANIRFAAIKSKYPHNPYVSMSFKDGKDNPSLTYQGEQYITNGFVKKQDGNWYLIGTREQKKEDGGAVSKMLSGGGVVDKKIFEPVEIPLSADVAVKHGFTGKNAIKDLKEFLANKIKIDVNFD